MAQLHVEAEGMARATPNVVWVLVADANGYARWGPWDASGYQRPGERSAHGVGAVRWFRAGRTTTIERVLDVEDGRRLAYSVERGIPVRNYRAEVTLTPTAEGTRIRWAATGDATLAGRIVRRKLRTVYPDVVARLVAAADAGVPAP
jgi:uncharacterized protein YndB with AHSA1/START domain